MTYFLRTAAVKISQVGVCYMLSTKPGTASGDYCYLCPRLHLNCTAGKEQAWIQVSFALHSLIAHPPAASHLSAGGTTVAVTSLYGWLIHERAELEGCGS